MTENKRFYLLNYKNNPIYDSLENKEYNARYKKQREELCKLLNELNDECEFLEIENKALEDGATKYAELYHKSLKENDKLKAICKDHRDHAIDFKADCVRLEKENEELQQSVNNLKDTIVAIGIAYQKKHDGTLVDLVDGTLEEDIIDLIKLR